MLIADNPTPLPYEELAGGRWSDAIHCFRWTLWHLSSREHEDCSRPSDWWSNGDKRLTPFTFQFARPALFFWLCGLTVGLQPVTQAMIGEPPAVSY